MPFQKGNKGGKYERKYFWPNDQVQFLFDNWRTMTQKEIGLHLNISRGSVKDKLLELGLRKSASKMVWTREEDQFLLDHFETHCLSELAGMMKEKWPGKNFVHGTIRKRLVTLKLQRTEEQRKSLMRKIGPTQTFDDRWVARCIAGKKMHLYETILQQPHLIELKKNQLILKRLINESDTSKIS